MPVCQLLQTNKQGFPLLSSHRVPYSLAAWAVPEKTQPLAVPWRAQWHSCDPLRSMTPHAWQSSSTGSGDSAKTWEDPGDYLSQLDTLQMRKQRPVGRGVQRPHMVLQVEGNKQGRPRVVPTACLSITWWQLCKMQTPEPLLKPSELELLGVGTRDLYFNHAPPLKLWYTLTVGNTSSRRKNRFGVRQIGVWAPSLLIASSAHLAS